MSERPYRSREGNGRVTDLVEKKDPDMIVYDCVKERESVCMCMFLGETDKREPSGHQPNSGRRTC